MSELLDGVCDRCGTPFDWTWRMVDDTAYHKCDDVHPQAGHIGRWIHKDHYAEIKRLRYALTVIAEMNATTAQASRDVLQERTP